MDKSAMKGLMLIGVLYLLVYIGGCNGEIIQKCDVGCVCDGDVCEECAPNYNLQPVPPPESETIPLTSDPLLEVSDNGTTSATTSTSTSTATATTTTTITTTTPPPTETTEESTTATATTEQPEPSYVCVSQCYPGWYPYNGTCWECLVDRCALCTDNGTSCLVCEEGWHLQGEGCIQFSPIDITLITLSCVFGAFVLVVAIFGVVMCVRQGFCGACCARFHACVPEACKSCACPMVPVTKFRKTNAGNTIKVPTKEEILRSETNRTVNRQSSNNQRYTREPTLRRKEVAIDGGIVKDPVYPVQYKTSTDPGQLEYAIPDAEGPTPEEAGDPEEEYDEVEYPVESGVSPPQEEQEKKTGKSFKFFKNKNDKKSKKPKVGKKPKRPDLSQGQTNPGDVKPSGKVFRKAAQATPGKAEPQSPRGPKAPQPLPPPSVCYDEVPLEDTQKSEYGDTQGEYGGTAGGNPDLNPPPIYENVQLPQDVYGDTEHAPAQAEVGDGHIYGNVPSYENAHAHEGILRPKTGRNRDNKRDSLC